MGSLSYFVMFTPRTSSFGRSIRSGILCRGLLCARSCLRFWHWKSVEGRDRALLEFFSFITEISSMLGI